MYCNNTTDKIEIGHARISVTGFSVTLGTFLRGKMKSIYAAPRITNLSNLFLLSALFGLMPCAEDDSSNRKLVIYTVVTHVTYRVLNVSVLTYFLMITNTSSSLLTLLAVVTIMKCLCTTVHVIVVMRNRKKFLQLVSGCEETDFSRNTYRRVSVVALLFGIYLYSAGQFIQRRWLAAFRDVFSSIDVLCPILIILQFCTFLKIASDRFKTSRFHLIVYFYRTEDVLEQHLKNLELMGILKQLYTNQIFFCVSYLGLDFFVASYDTVERVISMENLEWVVCTTSYCTFLISTIFILCRTCEITKTKADKFDNELYLLMNENKALRSNVKLQLYLKRKVMVNFSASHFFDIGYPLVSTIVAATATYLIFLSQFSLLK